MNKRIFTGSYNTCKRGNLISISGDRGKKAGFTGKSIPLLAPKLVFWQIWHDNIGKISEEDNMRFYIEEYYKQVLSKVDIETLLENEKDPILLCYEDANQFCHRHILAEYIKLLYNIEVLDIEINENFEVKINDRPNNIKIILIDVINKFNEKEQIKVLKLGSELNERK